MPQTGESPLSALRRSQKPEDTSGKYKSYRDMPEGQREKLLAKLTAGQPNGSLARHRILNTIEQDPGSGDNFLRKAGMMATGSQAGSLPSAGASKKTAAKGSVIDHTAARDGTDPSFKDARGPLSFGAKSMYDLDNALVDGQPGGPGPKLNPDGTQHRMATADELMQDGSKTQAGVGLGGGGGNMANIAMLVTSLGGIEVVRRMLKASGSPKLAAIADGKIDWQKAMGDPELQQYMNTMVKAKGTGNTAVGMPISRDIGPAATAPMPPVAPTPEAAMDGQIRQAISGGPQQMLDYGGAPQPPMAENALALDNPMTQGAPQLQDMRAPQLQDSTSGPVIEVPPTGAQEADMDARWKAILGDMPMMQAPQAAVPAIKTPKISRVR